MMHGRVRRLIRGWCQLPLSKQQESRSSPRSQRFNDIQCQLANGTCCQVDIVQSERSSKLSRDVSAIDLLGMLKNQYEIEWRAPKHEAR